MELKTTHQIWKEHYHNVAEPEGELPCKKQWVAVDDLIKWIKRHETFLGDLPTQLSDLKKGLSQQAKQTEKEGE